MALLEPVTLVQVPKARTVGASIDGLIGAWAPMSSAEVAAGSYLFPVGKKYYVVRYSVGVGFLEGLKLLRFYAEFPAAPNFYTFTLLARFLLRALRARVFPILASVASLHLCVHYSSRRAVEPRRTGAFSLRLADGDAAAGGQELCATSLSPELFAATAMRVGGATADEEV